MPQPDPDEKFTLYPLEPDEVFRRLFGDSEGDGDDEVSDTPEDDELGS